MPSKSDSFFFADGARRETSYLINVGNNSVLQIYTAEYDILMKNLAATARNIRPPVYPK